MQMMQFIAAAIVTIVATFIVVAIVRTIMVIEISFQALRSRRNISTIGDKRSRNY